MVECRAMEEQPEERRKRFNDYGMLIATCIASIAAALAWNEARITRNSGDTNAAAALKIQTDTLDEQKRQFKESAQLQKDTQIEQQNEAAKTYNLQRETLRKQLQEAQRIYELQKDELKTQTELINAQREGMRRDVRPFVYAHSASWKTTGTESAFSAYVEIVPTIVGKSPALNVEINISCYLFPITADNHPFTMNSKPTIPPLDPTRKFLAIPISGVEGQQTSFSGACTDYDRVERLFNGDPYTSHIKGNVLLILVGEFKYQDIFTPPTIYTTPFCFEDAGIKKEGGNGTLRVCRDVHQKGFN